MNIEKARNALENIVDYALMADINPIGPHKVLKDFINEVEQLLNDIELMEKK